MRKVILIVSSILAQSIPISGSPEVSVGFDHSWLDRVLSTYVDDQGLVDYSGLKERSDDLDAYVKLLEGTSPKSHPGRFPTHADKLAYWINAYNAFVLKGVVDAYPVRSVKDIKMLSGFFNRTHFTAGGQSYTLNGIEHDILREEFDEPRIHAAINCASLGCPRMEQAAYGPQEVEERLGEAMRLFIRESRNVRIDRRRKVVVLSKIFDWFENDFTEWYRKQHNAKQAAITDYLRLYLPEADRDFLGEHSNIGIEYNDYDWTLNDQALR